MQTKHKTRHSFHLYKPLSQILSFFAFLPDSSKFHCCFSLFFCVSFLYWSVATFEHPDSVRSLDIIISILSSVCIAISIVQINFFQKNNFFSLLTNLKIIDWSLYQHYKIETKVNFMTRLRFINIFFSNILFILIEAGIGLSFFNLTFFFHHVAQYIPFPPVVLLIVQYDYFVNSIRRRCKLLNRKLLEQLNNITVLKNTKNPRIRSILHQNIKPYFFAKNYERVYDSVALVNEIFGVQILFIFAIIQVFIVKGLNIILTFISKETMMTQRFFIFASNLYGCFIFLCYGLLISSVCTDTVLEMKQATFIAWQLILKLPIDNEYDNKYMDIEEGLIFVQTITLNRLTHFSAAGFFTVDFTVMFSLISSVSSVVILIIQLFA
ncbi:uncharacterized protein LOC107397547 [Tribolium castaneum]|uniref:Gustatory receptor n=1 Tax=Tribolium castaneum TaxID=7070 RepID=D6WDS1_TRICA|nr:PREDICTED: uncharacterized protein LOC107397547 [Tribolium castaneum]EFA01381.1 gustatory receptor 90 [Tribolium castaneum]|eukprot:XP_015833608.1 PREDICTED: uncharacterized protein LOC107397547 [Tribolium castaneum]